MSGVYGRKIKMTIFGESHGASIGLVIDGLPPGLGIDIDFIKREMERRAPGRNLLSTQRQEKDAFLIQSGVFEGRTTGTPLCALIPNSDSHSKDYSILKDNMRPGHADYSGKIKYKGFNDYRGGGHFSGRLTAPLVFMGAVAKQALARYGIVIGAHINNVGEIFDRKFDPLGEEAELLMSLRQKEFAVLDDVRGAEMQALILGIITSPMLPDGSSHTACPDTRSSSASSCTADTRGRASGTAGRGSDRRRGSSCTGC